MNAQQRTMINKIAGLVTELADEHMAHLDRSHSKREALRQAELVRIKAQARHEEVTRAPLSIPSNRRQQYRDQSSEELRDAENQVTDLKATIERIQARMHDLAVSRDRARKLSEALLKVAKATHPDFARIDAGSLQQVAAR